MAVGEKMTRTRLRGLEIAGIQIGIEVPESCSWQWPAGDITDYSCLPRDPDVHVGVRIGDTGTTDLGGEQYAMGAWTFEVARQGEDWILGLSRSGHREQLAFFDKNFQTGEVVFSRDGARQPCYPLRSPIDEWIVLHRTVARGGLCLNAHARAEQGRARVRLGSFDSTNPRAWTSSTTTLLGRNTLWIRGEEDHRGVGAAKRERLDHKRYCVYRTPWGDAMDRSLGAVAEIVDFSVVEDSTQVYRERLDPCDAADLLVTHAVVPVCDEGLLERVLSNAKRISEHASVVRLGEMRESSAPMAWRSPQLQSGFAPPRSAV